MNNQWVHFLRKTFTPVLLCDFTQSFCLLYVMLAIRSKINALCLRCLCLCGAVWSDAAPTSLRAKHQSNSAWLLNSSHGLTERHINGYNAMMWFHALVGGFLSLQVLIEDSATFAMMTAKPAFYLQSRAIWRSCCIEISQVGSFWIFCAFNQRVEVINSWLQET